ncbi:hypothetical protein [Halomonas sp. C05BenzN]|uniref:hypothetical protein n=1 Tax=Halomonas sp. C05BenzN TaxID=3411041 RepID=UPI003B94381C
MWCLRLLYLGHRYMPMRPDTLLVMTVMLVIIGAGAATLYMDSEQPSLLTVGVGLAVTVLQVTVMVRFPGIADGLSWSGLIIEELKSSNGVVPDAGRGAARRQIVRHLEESGDVPDEVVRRWLSASRA